MAKIPVKKGAVDTTVNVLIQDATSNTGAGLTGLAYNSSGLVCYYVRERAAATQLSLATLAAVDSAHSDGGFKEIDATNMPGVYRLDLSDAVCATGSNSVAVLLKGAANMAPCALEISLTDHDPNELRNFKKNVARANFAFPMFDSANALKTGLTVTASIRKDAGSFAALAGSVTEIGSTGWYTVDFAQAETNADTIAFSATASGALPTCYTILTQA